MIFAYPEQARVERVLPKNKLYANAKVSATLKRKFIDRIDKIVWEYKLSPETVNLPPKKNAPEIEVFTVELRDAEPGEDVLRCIDNAIPFPIIFELVYENRVKTKAAFKRPSEADAGKWVTEIYFESEWQPVEARREELPVALDLGILYEKIVDSLLTVPKSDGEAMRDYVQRMAEIRRKESEAEKLEARIRKEKQFNRKVELNAELRKLKNEREQNEEIMKKLKMHTPDFSDENIARLAELFPNCVTESRDENGTLKRAIDFDLLKQELSGAIVEGVQERYHLDWVGKREALLTANAPVAKTLRPCREESVDFETTKNLYIEGDNLDALKLLQETYLGKVKMIYIDPPYNTGRNLIYKNDFSEDSNSFLLKSNQEDETGNKLVANPETSGRFHSDWLSMIYPRLKLSRNLLRDDGVIAIAIDHNEFNTLSSVCDEIFGQENRLGVVTVVHKPEGRQFANFFSPSNEFMQVYAKNKDSAEFEEVILDSEKEKKFNFNDGKGNFKLKNFIRLTDGKYSLRENKPDGFYSIFVSPDLKSFSLEYKPDYLEALPITNKGVERVWKTSGKTFLEKVADDLIIAEKENGKIVLYEKLPPSQVLVTHWIKKEYHSYHFGTKLVDDLLGAKTFDFPKSLNLVLDVLKITTNSDDLVVDFFSGSATTAHAVMQLNAEDGGNRQFIMVQIPEETDEESDAYKAGYKTITEIGKERIRRAGRKIKEENPLTTKNLDTGFRVLKVDTSNMKDVYYAPDNVEQGSLLDAIGNVKEDRTDEDLLFQVLLDWGVDLSVSIARETIASKNVFFVDETAVAACFETGITEDFVKELAKREPLRAVFKDSGFADDNVKINVEQIFKLMSPSTEVKTI